MGDDLLGTPKTGHREGTVPAGTSRSRRRFSCELEDAESVYFSYLFTALPIDGPALARSSGFMTGLKETFAPKARNQGSAIAGICDVSFISKTIEADRLPLSSAKK